MGVKEKMKRTDQEREVEVVYAPLRTGLGGLYDHVTRTIFIEVRLRPGAKRVTEAHERIHAERGDTKCHDPWFNNKQELAVERETARRLITVDDLAEALMWCQDDRELADYLNVDNRCVRTRRSMLTEAETEHINALMAGLEKGI